MTTDTQTSAKAKPSVVKRIVQIVVALIILALLGGTVYKWPAIVWHVKKRLNIDQPVPFVEPKLITSTPANADGNVALDAPVVAEVTLAQGVKIDATTATSQNVALLEVLGHANIPADVSVDETGLNVQLKSKSPLKPDTNYWFGISNLKDTTGKDVGGYSCAFTTVPKVAPSASVKFDRVELPTTSGHGSGFTCVRIGPDRKLYASADDGRLMRFPIRPDGTLGAPQIIDSLIKSQGEKRLMTGFDFDPKSTPENIVLYVTHGWYGFESAPDWTGRVARMSGSNLEKVEDIIVNLPRSVRDHLTNQCSFGPDGALYIPQGSNSAFGAADPDWAMRPERLLNAAILRVDLTKLPPGKPLDVKTEAGGTYDPFAPGAPLTIVASGIRMPYDMVFAGNGFLYTAVNGASAGGFTPDGPGAKALQRVPESEHDWLYKIDLNKPSRYHGHPNPLLKHYVLNGGNPTAGVDFAQVSQYPVGIQPDPDWDPAIFDFGCHVSANGSIQYKSTVFNGALKGKLVVCRYNVGSDLIFLGLGADGSVSEILVGLPGTTNLTNPLDLTEDTTSGNLYVSEYGLQAITLLRVGK